MEELFGTETSHTKQVLPPTESKIMALKELDARLTLLMLRQRSDSLPTKRLASDVVKTSKPNIMFIDKPDGE